MKKVIYKINKYFFEIITDNRNLVSLKRSKSNIENIIEEDEFSKNIKNQLIEYFNHQRKSFEIPYVLECTAFQSMVYEVLKQIPYGKTASYKSIASAIGNEKASRAVGNACNKNPLLLVIPCHRVISSNHSLTGYAGGIEMKQDLLDLESNSNH